MKEPWQHTQSELEEIFRKSDVPVSELRVGDVIFGGGRNTKAHYPSGMTANLDYQLYTVERVSSKSVSLSEQSTGRKIRLEKEPWHYSQSEREGTVTVKLIPQNLVGFENLTHKEVVERALKAGKPVPEDVLAGYPDLADKYGA